MTRKSFFDSGLANRHSPTRLEEVDVMPDGDAVVQVMTDSNWEEIIAAAGGKKVVLDLWAPWCGCCRIYAPEFEKAAGEMPEVIFARVNTDENPAMKARFPTWGIPHTVVLQNGSVLWTHTGSIPAKDVVVFVETGQYVKPSERGH